jgi:hypothetical protein
MALTAFAPARGLHLAKIFWGCAETPNYAVEKLQADPAHVHGSDSGRAQGETFGETNKEGDGKEKVGVDLSSLPERICGLHRDGKLPTPFGTEHIVEHLKGEFAGTYLRTVLANYCEETGDYVKKGQKAWFRRVSEGRYEIL